MSQVVEGPAAGDEQDRAGSELAVPAPGQAPDRFENPGLPPHRPRTSDVDRKAARRAELAVGFLFTLSMVGSVLTIVGYFAIRLSNPSYGELQLSNFLIGIGLFLTLFCIGIGAVHWAKTLMPDHEQIEERHTLEATPETKAEAAEIVSEGVADSGIKRRPVIVAPLVGSLALAPLPAVVLLKDLGPNPTDSLSTTIWSAGQRLVLDPQKSPIRPADLEIGAVAHVLPEALGFDPDEGRERGVAYLNEKAKAAVLLIRLQEDEVAEEARPGSYAGLVAYSKICTHMGCSVALYEQVTHHLLCPCHQTTFDVLQNCRVIFGPADRALPQLPIGVDDDGYLISTDGFSEPVGPSFWERG